LEFRPRDSYRTGAGTIPGIFVLTLYPHSRTLRIDGLDQRIYGVAFTADKKKAIRKSPNCPF